MIAITLKYKVELFNKRVIEKFEIERIYYERQDIDWVIVTENEKNKNISKIIADLNSYQILREIEGFLELDTGTLCNEFDKEIITVI